MADSQMFYVKNTGDKGKGQLAVGVQNAHEICASLTSKTLPPIELFVSSIGQLWFEQAFGVKVTNAEIDNVTDELERAQNEYEKHSKLAKQLKLQRTTLIRASLIAGASVEIIQGSSGQTASTIQEIAAEMTDTPEDTQRQLEQAVNQQKVETAKRRLKLKGARPKDEHEQQWIRKWGELKAADEDKRKSKKTHNGDEWHGLDMTEEEYDRLKREVETMLF